MLKAVGYPLIFSNWLMAGWAVAWVSIFIVSLNASDAFTSSLCADLPYPL